MLENKFQSNLIKKIRKQYPGCIIIKNDPSYIQGIPDLLILWDNKWCALEVKASIKSSHQPNQEYYINKMNAMSYAAFIYPENEMEVLRGVQKAFNS